MHLFVRPLATALVALTAAALPCAAQQAPLTPTQPYHQTFALNPIALPFGTFSADYERALSPAFTLGVGGTYADFDDNRERWFDVKALYWPNEEALKGFAVGLTAGYHSSTDLQADPNQSGFQREDGGATLGVIVDYNWLLGKRNRFLVGLGIGAKRVLKNVDENSALEQVLPSGRMSIGIAF